MDNLFQISLVVNGKVFVGDAYQIDGIALTCPDTVLDYLRNNESIFLKNDLDTWLIKTESIDVIGWRTIK